MADSLKLLLSGAPGKMAREILAAARSVTGVDVLPVALGSPSRSGERLDLDGQGFEFLPRLSGVLSAQRRRHPGLIAVDFSTPAAALDNVAFFCAEGIPFVCGTTGFDRAQAVAAVAESPVCAVIAPNMAVPIVLLQAAMNHLMTAFPGALAGHDLSIIESHQATKRDVSGTARAIVEPFRRLGVSAGEGCIRSVRDPLVQEDLGVPPEHLGGHAWHWFTITNSNGDEFEISTRVCGRQVYALGAIRAAAFVAGRMAAGQRGRVYSMEDVLAEAAAAR